MTSNSPPLARRLGLRGCRDDRPRVDDRRRDLRAFAPAAAAAGAGLLIGLVIAGVVAYCNATASAQLAAQYPTSGGTYVYGRERLGEWPGFLAGWSFVIGKTASCAAMALTFAAYAVPVEWQKPAAIAAVIGVAVVNSFGVTRTAALTRVIVVIVLVVLTVVVVSALSSGTPHAPEIFGGAEVGGPYGILQSAGLLFFAFAGLCPHRHDGRGGVRPGSHDPAGDRRGTGHRVRGLRGRRRDRAPHSRSRRACPLQLLRSPTWWRRARGAGRCRSSRLVRRWHPSEPCSHSSPGSAARRSRWLAIGDLPAWLGGVHPKYRVPHRAELTLAVGGQRHRAARRPARRDRILGVRRAALLLDRQCGGVHAVAGRSPLSARVAGGRR